MNSDIMIFACHWTFWASRISKHFQKASPKLKATSKGHSQKNHRYRHSKSCYRISKVSYDLWVTNKPGRQILCLNFVKYQCSVAGWQSKGQLISKANCQAEDSFKKRKNEFVFTGMRRVFVRFLEECSARKNPFEIIWPLRSTQIFFFSYCPYDPNRRIYVP